MRKQRLALIITSSVGIIAIFLPFVKVFFTDISFFDILKEEPISLIVLVGFIIPVYLSLSGDKSTSLSNSRTLVATFSSLIVFLFVLYIIYKLLSGKVTDFSDLQIGSYLIMLASISSYILSTNLKDK